MTPTRQIKLRKILRKYPEGLTTDEVSEIADIRASDVRRSLAAMPDVFVDRWTKGKRGQFMKIWCIVRVPEDCPHPRDRQYTYVPPKTTWIKHAQTKAA